MRRYHLIAASCFGLALVCYALAMGPWVPALFVVGMLVELAGWSALLLRRPRE